VTSADTAPEGIFLARPEGAEDVPPGMRLAVKDLFDTAGLVTTYGSILFAEHVPAETAEAVRRLEAAGCVDVGKTNLHEFAYGTTSENPHFGAVPNPLAPGRIAGGSSGGSAAALAAGLAEIGLGTDSGGSIRIPAACCGVVGLKPTYGLVPLDGCFPLASSFDHAGPMARDVDGCSRALQALAPGFDPTEVELGDVRIGVLWLELADPLVQERVDAAAVRFQHPKRLDVPLPHGIWPVFMREVADVHRELYEEHRDSYSENVGAKIERCLAVTDADYERAVETRELYRERLLDAAADVDLLLTPTLACVAPRTGQDELLLRETLTKLTFPFNATGWPALALPCGPAEDGLPASVQLAAPPGSDALVLAAGAALQQALSLD
jgi:aspartyl-tRNA(Asn)/glutamyl-tRNA(Gln) amidotransferase subunit A